MSASTQNRPDLASNSVATINYGVTANTHIYAGTHVMLVSGYLVPCADTSGGEYVGQAQNEVNNTTGTNGNGFNCSVIPPIVDPFKTLAATSPSISAWLHKKVYFTDDHTAVLVANSSNKVIAGKVVSIPNTTATGSVIVDTTQRFDLATD